MAFSKRQKKEIEVAGEKGQEILNKFHDMVPFIRDLSDKVQKRAALKGYIRTLSGRRCRFPIDEEKSTERYIEYQFLHKSLNKLIQGSSADQTKTAMTEIDRAGLPLQLQIHDEICASVSDRAQGEAIARTMENCIQLEVPSVVDVEIGPSWGEAK
jgi:DNA polymerase I-like protein with 3'-5' exonuclease and polymerase domains